MCQYPGYRGYLLTNNDVAMAPPTNIHTSECVW